MIEDSYYNRFEIIWKSVGCKSANEFALKLGFDNSEKIRRLKPDRAENKKQPGKINLPGIEIIESVLKKYPKVNARWLISGDGEPFISEDKIKSSYDENNAINKIEEPCQSCEKLKTEKMKLLEELNELNAKYRHLIETGTVKKETVPESGAQAG